MVCVRAHVSDEFRHVSDRARKKRKRVFGAVNWICVASTDEPDRAGIERQKEEACFVAVGWVSVACARVPAQAPFPIVMA